MWLIPGKTKVKIELIKGISLTDMAVGGVCAVLVLLILLSTLPFRWLIAGVTLFLSILLLLRIDTEPFYLFLLHLILYATHPKYYTNSMKTAQAEDQTIADAVAGEVQSILDGDDEEESTGELSERLDLDEEPDSESDPVPEKHGSWEGYLEIIEKEQEKAEAEQKLSRKEKRAKARAEKEAEKAKAKAGKKTAGKLKRRKRSVVSKKNINASSHDIRDIMAFTDIKDGLIDFDQEYYGAVVEIPPVEFRFFSQYRRNDSIINGVGQSIRSANPDYSVNIVKLDRPVIYDEYVQREYAMVDQLRASYEQGAMSEEEFKIRIELLDDRVRELDELQNTRKVIVPFYYMVFFDKNIHQLRNQMEDCVRNMSQADIKPKVLNDKELAVFLRYNYDIDFDEREIDGIDPIDYADWAMPKDLRLKGRTMEINQIVTNSFRVVKYPSSVGDAWLASVMSYPATRVMVKCKPMDRAKAVRKIDWVLQELRVQYNATSIDSKLLELQNKIESLSQLLVTLQNDNETLLNCNVYVTTFDIEATNRAREPEEQLYSERYVISNMKKQVRRVYQEQEFRLNNMEFQQIEAFVGGQVSSYDPLLNDGFGMPSNSVAACYPWIFANISDVGGMKMGSSDHVPVFVDFFRRDSERINSNMVIIGKSGSGKSYATKHLLTNLATEDAKIFILDPENEYTELSSNLHGKFINVGNAQFGRLNPFHIITALDDDEAAETVSGSYATHLQFLEEFFRQILPECEKDALEYLNSLVDRMYFNFGITGETNLSQLSAGDYPIFDDLYDIILEEFQKTDNEYIRTMLRTLMNYIAKFSAGGRNANIWNGPSTITTDENFTVFNFQSLLANRNQTIANAQMLMVLKYIDNEIIKNRDYNTKYHANRKIVVVIDEAHVFIDEKFPVALDFMFQLAKRIRKYNGMQIVITQNIKDFVGSEELAKKSTAIINACQYSMIFALAPNDMSDLCKLYEKAGGINEIEQESIMTAPRGQAFAVMSPTSRTTFQVEVPDSTVELFKSQHYQTHYFGGEDGEAVWEEFVGDSREKHQETMEKKPKIDMETVQRRSHVTFTTLEDDEEPVSVVPEAGAADAWVEEKEPKIPDAQDDRIERLQTARPQAVPKQFTAPDTLSMPAESEDITRHALYQVAAPQYIPAPQVHMDLSATNELLASFLEKFSSETIKLQVEQSVRTILDNMQLQQPVASVPQGQSVPGMELGAESAENIVETAEVGDVAEDVVTETAVETDAREAQMDNEEKSKSQREEYDGGRDDEADDEEESSDSDLDSDGWEDDEEEGGFDLMSMLNNEAYKLDEMSVIEQMIYYEEQTAVIRLEDLTQYTKSLRR